MKYFIIKFRKLTKPFLDDFKVHLIINNFYVIKNQLIQYFHSKTVYFFLKLLMIIDSLYFPLIFAHMNNFLLQFIK